MHAKRVDAHGDPEKVIPRGQFAKQPICAIEGCNNKHAAIHHKNGDRQDNRPDNLELWSSRQPKGQRTEDKVEYAIEILKQYAPERLA